MKIKEFIEKVNKRDGMRAKEVDKRIVIGTPNNMGIFSMPEDATNFIEIDTWATSNSLYWKKADREYLSSLIEELLHTPVKERFPEKKYVVVPEGLDSSNGPQLLSTDCMGRIFFAAKKNGLKQSFAEAELQNINNQIADGLGVSWLTPIINQYKKPVEDN